MNWDIILFDKLFIMNHTNKIYILTDICHIQATGWIYFEMQPKKPFRNEEFSCSKKVSVTNCSEVTEKLQWVVTKLWNSEFVEKFHDSNGCALSEDEGSDYNGYDSPSC